MQRCYAIRVVMCMHGKIVKERRSLPLLSFVHAAAAAAVYCLHPAREK
jgi:hypothetical protein